jgi:hypothetical protein
VTGIKLMEEQRAKHRLSKTRTRGKQMIVQSLQRSPHRVRARVYCMCLTPTALWPLSHTHAALHSRLVMGKASSGYITVERAEYVVSNAPLELPGELNPLPVTLSPLLPK